MKTKSLQKLTETQNKVEWLFSLNKVTYEDLKQLSESENKEARRLMNEKITTLKDVAKERFIEQFIGVWDEETRNRLWENNHSSILWAISSLMQDGNRMPSAGEIAAKTNLSRNTVSKHLKDYKNNALFLEQKEQFAFMFDRVMTTVYNMAVQGDIRACSLYLETVKEKVEKEKSDKTIIRVLPETNYIQINNTFISDEVIQKLNAEQLKQIETILISANR